MRLNNKILRGKDIFFTSDEHFGHRNIIKYTGRPFDTVEEMDEELIDRFNRTVSKNGFTIHGGDFCLGSREYKEVKRRYIDRLNGEHFFILGSHDIWLNNKACDIVELRRNGVIIVTCHYALRTWAASHYNSYHLYGHSHGNLPSIGKSYDIGVDNTNFYPVSFTDILTIMETKPDNPNLIRK